MMSFIACYMRRLGFNWPNIKREYFSSDEW